MDSVLEGEAVFVAIGPAVVVFDLLGPESPELYADDFRVTEEHGVEVASVVGLQVLVVGIDGEFGNANFEIRESVAVAL